MEARRRTPDDDDGGGSHHKPSICGAPDLYATSPQIVIYLVAQEFTRQKSRLPELGRAEHNRCRVKGSANKFTSISLATVSQSALSTHSNIRFSGFSGRSSLHGIKISVKA